MKFSFFILSGVLIFSVPILGAASLELQTVKIDLKIPANTPPNEKIFVTGNDERLGAWKPDLIEMKRVGSFSFSFEEKFPVGSDLEFKFCRGSFSTIEKDKKGEEIPNRKFKVKKGKENLIECVVEGWADRFPAKKADIPLDKLEITGKYKFFKDFSSKFLKEKRDIVVLLPKHYDSPKNREKRYPVLYMHDGNNLFDPRISFLKVDWGLDEAVEKLTSKGEMKEIIVVGISNTPERNSEYTPFKDSREGGGNGDCYSEFIVKELKPFIDANFRTSRFPHETAVGGSSLGALISLYIGISLPDLFGGIIAMSPALWWADEAVIPWVLSQPCGEMETKIWMDMGLLEGKTALRGSRKFAREFRKKFPRKKGFVYKEYPHARHHESAWRKRIHQPLKFLFGEWPK